MQEPSYENNLNVYSVQWIKMVSRQIEYYVTLKSKEFLLYIITRMNLEDTVLRKVSQLQKYKYFTIPLIRGVSNGWTHRIIKDSGDPHKLGKHGSCSKGIKSHGCRMSMQYWTHCGGKWHILHLWKIGNVMKNKNAIQTKWMNFPNYHLGLSVFFAVWW